MRTYSRIGVPDGLTFAALVPGFRLTTEDARRALPESYSRGDAVFNVGRAALLAASFASGDFGALRVAMDDNCTSRRLGLIPHSAEVIRLQESRISRRASERRRPHNHGYCAWDGPDRRKCHRAWPESRATGSFTCWNRYIGAKVEIR